MRENILVNIVKIRSEKGFSQEFVASEIGLKQSGYGLIERGERALTYERLMQIAIVFDMDVIDIITYPKKYTYSESENETKVLVEISLSNEDFEKTGIRQRVINAMHKKTSERKHND